MDTSRIPDSKLTELKDDLRRHIALCDAAGINIDDMFVDYMSRRTTVEKKLQMGQDAMNACNWCFVFLILLKAGMRILGHKFEELDLYWAFWIWGGCNLGVICALFNLKLQMPKWLGAVAAPVLAIPTPDLDKTIPPLEDTLEGK